MTFPLVSVIIPIYNSVHFIKECVDSVINQTYQNTEIILIDDGSIDGSYEFINKNYSDLANVKILSHLNRQNRGVTETRRLGIKNACGEFLAFLDADDFFHMYKIENQIKLMIENPDVVLVHSKITFINVHPNDNRYFDFSFGSSDKKYNIDIGEFIDVNHICNSTVLVRKDIFLKVAFTSNHAFQYEDWIQWVLLAEYGKYYYMNISTCNYRYHPNSNTAVHNKNGKTNLYANFEKNIILEEAFRGHQKHALILNRLQISLDEIYNNLFYKKIGPILIFNNFRFFKSILQIHNILTRIKKIFNDKF